MTKSAIATLCLFMATHILAQDQEKCSLLSRFFSKARKYQESTVEERVEENIKKAAASFVYSSKNDVAVSYWQILFGTFPHTLSHRPKMTKGRNLVEQGRNLFKPGEGEYDQAMELFTRATQKEDNPALVFQAYKYRGIAHYMKKDIHQAMEDFDEAIAIGKLQGEDLHELYLFRALTKILSKDKRGTIAELSKMLPTDNPKFAALAYYLRAPYYASNATFDKAIKDYTQLLKIHPQDALAHFQLAKLYTRLKRPEAIDSYQAALKWGLGKEYNVHLYYGYTLFTQGHVDKALEILNHAVTLSPKDARGLHLRSYVKKLLGDTEGSEDDLNTALLLNSSIEEWSPLNDDQFLNTMEI